MNRVIEDVRDFRTRMKTLAKVEAGVSVEGLLMLLVLVDGPMKMSRVADALVVTNGAATNLADGLVEKGYMRRDRSNDDRRVVNVTLTDSGRKAADAAVAAYEKAFPASGAASS